MIVSILLVLFLVAITFYVHKHLTEKQRKHNMSLAPIRIPKYDYNEILIDTPIESPNSQSSDENDDIISMGSEDAMSMVSLEDYENIGCNKGSPVEMPRGIDKYQTLNDNAKHHFSSQEQMRVFDKHDFVKDIGNNRVNVDTTNSVHQPSIRNPQNTEPCLAPGPIGVSSLAGYGTLMASYENNTSMASGIGGYMSGVVPYQG
jgi:hypothetical protein